MSKKPLKIGITGQAGFIGTHLYNMLGLMPKEFVSIKFEDEYFNQIDLLYEFVKECDVIVHLAAMNRHSDPNIIYQTNINLSKQIIEACNYTQSKPHIIFSSSTQEERDNLYGKSKKECREFFEQWALENNAEFTGIIIPNVFGPFGRPFYNSVVATFCHQLTHNEQPSIDVDGVMTLIYVGDLIQEIIRIIKDKSINKKINQINLKHTAELKVSELLILLQTFKNCYFEKGEIPSLANPFERNLFNTFHCYIDHRTFFPFPLKLNTDERGSFVETIKLNSGGQISFSTTKRGITRGNHFHSRKAERFAVIRGKARIEMRKIGTSDILSFELDGQNPSFVDMPVWFTHNITNVGDDDLYTIFWISEHFDSNDPDTFFEEV